MIQETDFDIITGPDRLEIVHSIVFQTKTVFVVQPVSMIVIQAIEVVIGSIELESGDGHSWNLRGRVFDTGTAFKAYYQTDPAKPRTGKITITSNAR